MLALMRKRTKVWVGVAVGVALIAASAVGLKLRMGEQTRAAACAAIEDTESRAAAGRARALDRPGELIAFLGDSFTEGMKIDDPLSAYPTVVGDALEVPVLVNGVGGSGFANSGPCPNSTFAERLPAVLEAAPSTIIIQSGLNDLGRDAGGPAADLFDRIESQLPDARIVVLGAFSPPNADPHEVDAFNQAVSKAAAENGAEFVDVSLWNVEYLPDGLHPTEGGHRVIGEAVAAALRS